MSYAKSIAAAALLTLATTAYAGSNSQGPHGGIAAARGIAASRAASQASHAGQNGQSGQGGSYWAPVQNASAVDAFQPWPEAEMRKFQKPRWEPYTGNSGN